MNKLIEELAIQAGLESVSDNLFYAYNENLEHFADLVRQDEREKCSEDYLDDCVAAVEAARLEEREACAKLCESMGVYPELNVWNGGPDWYKRQKECAAAIRGRKT